MFEYEFEFDETKSLVVAVNPITESYFAEPDVGLMDKGINVVDFDIEDAQYFDDGYEKPCKIKGDKVLDENGTEILTDDMRLAIFERLDEANFGGEI
jgi:hypothetical protein